MTQLQSTVNELVKKESEVLREQPLLETPIDHILQKLSDKELPAKEHLERYLRHKWRLNHKPRTLASSFTSVMFFLDFYGRLGKREIEKIERVDLEGFIEHEQDRGYEIREDSSYSVCQSWGVADNGFYLVHQFRERLEYPDLLRMVKHLANQFSPDFILIEYQASGRSLVQDLYNNTRLPIKGGKTTRESKQLRAELVTPLIESGRVFLPQNAKWISDFLYELTVFPAGSHSDQVDALSQALLFLRSRFDATRRSRRERLAAVSAPQAGSERLLSARRRLRFDGGPRLNLFNREIDRI